MKKSIFIIIIAITLLVLGLLQSCTTERKAVNWLKKNPDVAAAYCAQAYPVKQEFIKGKDSIRTDTVEREKIVKVPVVVKGDTIYVEAKCPKASVVTKTVYRVDTVVKESTAKLASVEGLLSKSNNDLFKERTLREEAENASKSKTWWMFGMGAVLVGILILLFRK